MTRSLRFTAALAVACLAFFGVAGVAGAVTYSAAAVTTGQNVQPGSTDVASGTGFTPDTTVTVTLGAEVLGSVLVASDGTFSLSYTTPTTCGSYTLTATNGIESQTTTLTVACAAAVTTGSLPYTGNDSSLPLAQIGAGLLAVGAVAVFGVRKRNQHLAHVKVDA
jgi:LPXTG-motif cell wall-anchored protein